VSRHAPRIVTVILAMAVTLSCMPDARVVVLITLDTTRADRLGCYGYKDAETPHLDALAASGVRFAEAMATVPVTLPSHASMFTGNLPPVHGIRYNGMFKLSEASTTLAELLAQGGWVTVGVPAGFPLGSYTGISQGFTTYDDVPAAGPESLDSPWRIERSAAVVTDVGIDFLRKVGERRTFLWLHYFDPHEPYTPPFPFSARYRARPYDGEIAYVDRELGRLFDAMRELGLWERSLVVVAGDHGEGLYQHNEKMHANLVYQSTLHVPLILKPPGWVKPRVVEQPVSLIDIAPTVLDFAGVAGPSMEGMSLRPIVYGASAPSRSLYFESLAGALVHGWSPLEGIRRGRFKYTRSSEPELFDLAADPGETDNVVASQGAEAFEMNEVLEQLEASWREKGTEGELTSVPLDPDEAETLASLGYLGGFVTQERRGGPHPKDRIHLEGDMFVARDQILAGDCEAGLKQLEQVLAEDPVDRYALQGAATAAARLARYDTALQYTARLLEIYPEFTPGRILQGEIHVSRGELERAVEDFRTGLEHSPDDSGLSYRLGVALFAQGQYSEARDTAERMIAKGSEVPSFLVLKAACDAGLGDADGSMASLRDAIARGYRDREVLTKEPLLEPLRRVPGFDEAIAAIPGS
jgi:hypothetical protein